MVVVSQFPPEKFSCHTSRDELGKPILLVRRDVNRCRPINGAGAVPGMGLVTRPRAVWKLARPATTQVCQELAAPGRGSVVRDHEARDRTEPRPRGFGESRSGAPKGERSFNRGRAGEPSVATPSAASRHTVCAYRRSASPYLFGGKAFVPFVEQPSGRERKAQRENENLFVRLRSTGGFPQASLTISETRKCDRMAWLAVKP
jgi:hypothetical protein